MPKKISESYELIYNVLGSKVGTSKNAARTPVPAPCSSPLPSTACPVALQPADKPTSSLQTGSSLRLSRSYRSTITSAISVSEKPVVPRHVAEPKASRKTRYLQLVVIIAVVVAFLLIIGLTVLLYFVLSTHEESLAWIGTAHDLCQERYGNCSMFAGESDQSYPPNCTLIPCRYRCLYPTRDLNVIDPHFEKGGHGYSVAGKDGLICEENSLCKGGTCVRTPAKEYDPKIDPESTVACVRTMYGATTTSSSGCAHTDKCHEGHVCMDKGQIAIGFNVSCSGSNLSTCTNIKPLGCGKICDHVDNTTKNSHMRRLKERKCNWNRKGLCFHRCHGGSKINAQDGVPCNGSRRGYCWKGRCFERERFVHKDDVPDLIDKDCYGKDENVTCYYNPHGYCFNQDLLDRYRMSMTRYGYNCYSWDQDDAIPKKYRKLRSYGCILHDKKMPWCYSRNPNVVWNYCYNLCPEYQLAEKRSGRLRVITFYFSAHSVNIHAMAKSLASHIQKMNPDIILTSSWPSTRLSTWKKDLTKATKGVWKGCGGLSSQKTHSIFIREANGTTINLTGVNRSAGCMVTKFIHNTTLKFAVIATHLPDGDRSPDKFCHGSQGAGDVCQGKVTECEKPRISDAKKLIHAVEKALGKNLQQTNIILGGSFNQPSHLDWTPRAAHLHCNSTYSWTISKLMQKAGYRDTYRSMWKDPSASPGITWSPLEVYRKRQKERLDYIYFRGPMLVPDRADTYPVTEPGKPFAKDWPSDRYAVVADYIFV